MNNEEGGIVVIDRLQASNLTNNGTVTINGGFDGQIQNSGGTVFYNGTESLGAVNNSGTMYVSSGCLTARSLFHNEYSNLKKNENENLDVLTVIGGFDNTQSTVEVNDLISVGTFENEGAVVKTKKLVVSESFKTTDYPDYQNGNFVPTASLVEVDELEITGKEAASSIGDQDYRGNYSPLSQLVIHNKLTLSNAHTLNNYAGLFLTGDAVTVEGDGIIKNQTVTDNGSIFTGVIAKDEEKNAVDALKVSGTLENTGELYARTLEVEKGFDGQEGQDVGVFDVDNFIVSAGGDFALNRSETKLQTVTVNEDAKLTASKTVNLSEASTITNNGGTATFGTVHATQPVGVIMDKGTVDIANLDAQKLDVTMNSLDGKLTVTESANDLDTSVTVSSEANKGAAKDVLDKVVDSVSISKDGSKVDYLVTAKPGTITDGWTANSGDPENIKTEKNPSMDAFASINAMSAVTLLHEMDSLSKRMSELRDAPNAVGAWARLYGSDMEHGKQHVKSEQTTVQVGTDMPVGDWRFGAAFNYTDGEGTLDAGTHDNKNYGFALYGTWFIPCGAYVDLVAKYTRMDNEFQIRDLKGSYDNDAFTLSAETGYRFNLLNDVAFVEPQVQVMYGQIKGDTFNAGQGVMIAQDNYDSLIGRVGVRAGFRFPDNKGTIYARLSGAYEFDGEVSGTARDATDSNTLEADFGGGWLEVGLGANFNLTDNTYTFVDLERTNGGPVKEDFRWTIGVRHSF